MKLICKYTDKSTGRFNSIYEFFWILCFPIMLIRPFIDYCRGINFTVCVYLYNFSRFNFRSDVLSHLDSKTIS